MSYTGSGTKENPFLIRDWLSLSELAPMRNVYIKFQPNLTIDEVIITDAINIRCREIDFNGLVVNKVKIHNFTDRYIKDIYVNGVEYDALTYTSGEVTEALKQRYIPQQSRAVWIFNQTDYHTIVKNATFNEVELNTVFDIWMCWLSNDMSTGNCPIVKNINFKNIHSRTIVNPSVMAFDPNLLAWSYSSTSGNVTIDVRMSFFSYNVVFDSCFIDVRANRLTPLSLPDGYFNDCRLNLSTYTIDNVKDLFILTQITSLFNCQLNIDCYLFGNGTFKVGKKGSLHSIDKLPTPRNSIITFNIHKDLEYVEKIDFYGNVIGVSSNKEYLNTQYKTMIVGINARGNIKTSDNPYTYDTELYNNLVYLEDTAKIDKQADRMNFIHSSERYPKNILDFTIPNFYSVELTTLNKFNYDEAPEGLTMHRDGRINNNLPFLPLYDVPIYNEADSFRRKDVRFRDNIPVRCMYNDKPVTFYCVTDENKDYDIYWQKAFDTILDSQVYGNFFNNTQKLKINEDRKNNYVYYHPDYLYKDSDEISVELHNTSHTNEYVIQSVDYGKNYTPYELLEFNNVATSGLVMSSVDHLHDDLKGTNCYYTISENLLNTCNFTICMSVDNTVIKEEEIHTTDEFNNLIVIPINIGEHVYNFFIAENLNEIGMPYYTNINPDRQPEPIDISRRSLTGASPNSNIFTITCNINTLYLYVNGILYSSAPLLQSTVIGDIFDTAYVGYCEGVDVSKSFNGTLLSMHVFSEYCSPDKIWKVFNILKKELYPPEEIIDNTPLPMSLYVDTEMAKLSYTVGERISTLNLAPYLTYTDGTSTRIPSRMVYSLYEDKIDILLLNTTQNKVLCRYTENGVTYHTSYPISVYNSNVATITLLDSNYEPTDTYETFTTLASASTRLKALITSSPNNLYSLDISDDINVSSIAASQFNKCSNIYSLHISNSITTIGKSAFSYCTNLKELTIPDTVRNIDAQSFEYCNNLTTVTIGTGIDTLPSRMFYNCPALTTVTIPNNISTIDTYCFQNCTSLDNISIPDSVNLIGVSAFDNTAEYNKQSNIYYIDKWFVKAASGTTAVDIKDGTVGLASSCCKSITSLLSFNMPNTVKYINNQAFESCTKLANIQMSANIEAIRTYAFRYCNALTQITLGNKLKYIQGETFSTCTLLNQLILPISWNVTMLPSLFINGCPALKSITIPEGTSILGTQSIKSTGLEYIELPQTLKYIDSNAITGLITEIHLPKNMREVDDYAFTNITTLKTLDISNYPATISGVFKMSSIEEFIVSDDNESFTAVDGILYSKDMSTLIKYPNAKVINTYTIPETVVNIHSDALQGATGLNNLIIPNSIQSLGTSLFENSTVETVSIPQSVTSIDDTTFQNTPNLQSITVNTANNNYTDVNGILYNKQITKLIAYPSKSVIATYIMPNTVTDVAGINMFANNKIIQNVSLSNKLTTINGTMFRDNTSIKTIDVPSSVTDMKAYAFYKCSALETITLNANITAINEYTFYNCSMLQSIQIPTTVKTIGRYVFYGCSKFTSIDIPSSVTAIGSSTFANCTNLRAININKAAGSISGSPWGSNTSYVNWLG